MEQLVLLLHVLVAICIVALVLIQHGKGADAGAAFGSGSANTMFGSSGPAPFMLKLTGVLAAIFFITSITLTYFTSGQRQADNVLVPSPTVPATDVPLVPTQGAPQKQSQ